MEKSPSGWGPAWVLPRTWRPCDRQRSSRQVSVLPCTPFPRSRDLRGGRGAQAPLAPTLVIAGGRAQWRGRLVPFPLRAGPQPLLTHLGPRSAQVEEMNGHMGNSVNRGGCPWKAGGIVLEHPRESILSSLSVTPVFSSFLDRWLSLL